MRTDQEIVFESSRGIKEKLNLPPPISAMFKAFERSISLHQNFLNHTVDTTEVQSQLHTAFDNFKREEKINHYALCVDLLHCLPDKAEPDCNPKLYDRPMAHVNAEQKSGLFGFSEKTLVIIDFRKKTLLLGVAGRREERVQLKNYLMRESKNPKKHCLIFDAIVKQELRPTLRLFFEDYIYPQAKRTLKKLMEDVEKDRLYNQVAKHRRAESMSVTVKAPDHEANFLKQGNVDAFRSLFQTLKQNEDQETQGDRLEMFSCSYKTITTNGNVYYLQELFFLSKQEMTAAISIKIHKWNSMCQDSILIESSRNEMVYCEKYLHNDRVYSTTYIMTNQEAGKGRFALQSVKNDSLLVDHTLRIDFVYIKISKISNEISQLSVKARMDTMDSNRQAFVVDYLKEFSNLYEVVSTFKENIKSANQFKKPEKQRQQTVYLDAIGFEEVETLCNDEYNSDSAKEASSDVTSRVSSQESGSEHIHSETHLKISRELQCLISRHPQTPLGKQPPQIMKNHYLDAEWVRNKNGGLMCINQRILGEQKKVLKHVLSTFGRNLLYNKGILNISLPVTVCTKISHLQMIATNFIYGPLLMEPSCHSSPLERMKNLVVFLITIGNTGISSEKPFNPILGETFQGMINGCPIYLEQISHHPPQSAYLMEGRGYKIVGTIEPKVQPTGINSVRCYSERQNRIEFDDGSVVYMSFPKISLKGLIFGSREFDFEGRNFLFDTKNLIFAEVNYGPKTHSFLGGSKDPVDLVYGDIYKVTPEFKKTFMGSKTGEFPSKGCIERKLTDFEGTWTQSLRFNRTEFFNFRSQLPCILEGYNYPLPSDSSFRTDIQRLCQNQLKEAQIEKDRWEEIQRRDRTLREKFSKK